MQRGKEGGRREKHSREKLLCLLCNCHSNLEKLIEKEQQNYGFSLSN